MSAPLRSVLSQATAVALAASAAIALALLLPQPAHAASALVLQDGSALRAAPKDAAPLLTPLTRGEALEVRGTQGDWLQVWDHRRERGGFVRADRLLPLPEGATALPELSAQLRLVRRQPGAEALGLGLAAAVIERAPADWLTGPAGAELLDALVEVNERLAERTQAATLPAQQTQAAAQAEVAARYGYPLRPVPLADGSQRLCANPEPARLLRGHPAARPDQQARAALAMTRPECLSADTPAHQWAAVHAARAQALDGINLTELPGPLRNRLLLRRVGVLSSQAFAQRAADAATPANQALAAWTQLLPAELADDDAPALREAALRLGPVRWAARPALREQRLGQSQMTLSAGATPGETCLRWQHPDAQGRWQDTVQRCTHAWVHPASARLSPDGRSLVLAVQPLDGWTELWRLGRDGTVQVLPPSAAVPGLGLAEFAGWAPAKEGAQLLVAREAAAEGKVLRRFEVYGADFVQPLRWATEPGPLVAFQRSTDAAWKAGSPLAR